MKSVNDNSINKFTRIHPKMSKKIHPIGRILVDKNIHENPWKVSSKIYLLCPLEFCHPDRVDLTFHNPLFDNLWAVWNASTTTYIYRVEKSSQITCYFQHLLERPTFGIIGRNHPFSYQNLYYILQLFATAFQTDLSNS